MKFASRMHDFWQLPALPEPVHGWSRPIIQEGCGDRAHVSLREPGGRLRPNLRGYNHRRMIRAFSINLALSVRVGLLALLSFAYLQASPAEVVTARRAEAAENGEPEQSGGPEEEAPGQVMELARVALRPEPDKRGTVTEDMGQLLRTPSIALAGRAGSSPEVLDPRSWAVAQAHTNRCLVRRPLSELVGAIQRHAPPHCHLFLG